MDLYPTCDKCGCPRHPGLGCGCESASKSTAPLPDPCPLCKRATNALRAETAEAELKSCRDLLDLYGFHQTGIHNGIAAMQNRILNLEAMLKSYE